MAFAGRGYGCRQHHLVWFQRPGDVVTQLAIGCAHCSFVHSRFDLGLTTSEDLAEECVRSSRGAHARLCDRARERRPRRAQ